MRIFSIFTAHKNKKLFLLAFVITFFVFVLPSLPMVLKINTTGTYKLFPMMIMYYTLLSFTLLKIYTITSPKSRLLQHLAAITGTAVFYAVYVATIYLITSKKFGYDDADIILHISMWGLCMLIGYTSVIAFQKSEREKEIEQLKVENLQSRCEALSNQINPHFFFNSLNGIAVLIRADKKEDSLEFLNQISKVFRYILQVNKENLITLEEEMSFLKSYMYMLEIRHRGNLTFDIAIDPGWMDCRLPTLSLLPLVENVVKHNIIDSRHPMRISIKINRDRELVISNPIQEKLEPVESNHIGLSNLSARYKLLVNSDIKININKEYFTVCLPLINEKHENTDS